MQAANPRRGYILGLSAYIIWGLFPIYFKVLAQVPSVEIIVNRAIWSAIFGSLLLLVWKHPGWWQELRDNPRRLAVLAVSGSLIAANWLIYVWAVNNDHMVEASLGYFINPLINVMLGMVLLRERLRPLQWGGGHPGAYRSRTAGLAGRQPAMDLAGAGVDLWFLRADSQKGAGRRTARTGGRDLDSGASGGGLVAV